MPRRRKKQEENEARRRKKQEEKARKERSIELVRAAKDKMAQEVIARVEAPDMVNYHRPWAWNPMSTRNLANQTRESAATMDVPTKQQ